MNYNKLNLFGLGIIGGIIAIIGFWILSPSTDSVVSFVLLRAIIGAIVAMIVGPIMIPSTKK